MTMKEDRNRAITWKPASTVILLREQTKKIQVYLLRRNIKSRFFPGNYVFPGGVVDPEDWVRDGWEDHVDMGPDEISRRLGGTLTLEEIIGYGISAVRETFEEAGVFLGEPHEGRRGVPEKLLARRMAGELQRGWFWEWVVSHGWSLSFSNLARWAQWITPELMPKHFDTRFFVAFMPPRQVCEPDDRETTHGVWITPEEALFQNLDGNIPLSPPTVVTLHELLEYASLADLKRSLKTRSWGDARFPRMIRFDKDAVILQPWDPERHEDVDINPKELEKALLPVGAPFSRIWLHDGIWRPVAY
jgi:8-oxo-dGTP pyrophosphatase MutT (NUDIX family)